MKLCVRIWNATSPPIVSVPSSTRRPPTPRTANDAQEREQRWGDVRQGRGEHQSLARVQGVGVKARPACEEVPLAAAGLQRLDHVDAVHRSARHLALLLEEAARRVIPCPRGEAQHDQIGRHDGDCDQRQRYVVGQHHRGVEHHRQQVDPVHGQLVRQQPGDGVVRLDAANQVAGVALAEELHGQRRYVPEEARRHDDGELRLHPGQERPLQPEQRALHGRRGGQSDQQCDDPVAVPPNQHVVDEHASHRRHGHAGNEQGQSCESRERESSAGLSEARAQATGPRSAANRPAGSRDRARRRSRRRCSSRRTPATRPSEVLRPDR